MSLVNVGGGDEDAEIIHETGTESFLGFQNDSVVLSHSSLVQHANLMNGADGLLAAKVVFFSYKNLHDQFDNHNPRLGQLEDSLESDYFSYILNSRIISASLSATDRRSNLAKDPVTVRLHHLEERRGSSSICIFWDHDQSAWSDKGCKVVQSETYSTLCQCSHLTSFAVLMRVPKDEIVGGGAGAPRPDNSDAVILSSDRIGSSGILSDGSGPESDWILQIVTYLVAAICLLILILILVQVRTGMTKLSFHFVANCVMWPRWY